MSLALVTDPNIDKERNDATRQLDQAFRSMERAFNILEDVKSKIHPPRVTASLGRVSKRIYQDQPGRQNDLVARLPPEIQSMVWSHLVVDADRIAFGLTCKSHAALMESLKHLHLRHIRGISRDHRLQVLIRLMSWVPPELRLCFNCVRYCRRHSIGEWGGHSVYEEAAKFFDERGARRFTSGDMGVVSKSRDSTVPKDATVKGARCPKCRYQISHDHVSSSEKYKQILSRLKRHNFHSRR